MSFHSIYTTENKRYKETKTKIPMNMHKGVRNRGGNGDARPRNAETAGVKVSFRPRKNMPSLLVGYTVLHSRTAGELT